MPFLKTLKIEHFKGFGDQRNTFSFAVPSGEPGSGLSVIVGPNSYGKSTVFDALLKLASDKRFPQSERDGIHDVTVTLTDTDGNRK